MQSQISLSDSLSFCIFSTFDHVYQPPPPKWKHTHTYTHIFYLQDLDRSFSSVLFALYHNLNLFITQILFLLFFMSLNFLFSPCWYSFTPFLVSLDRVRLLYYKFCYYSFLVLVEKAFFVPRFSSCFLYQDPFVHSPCFCYARRVQSPFFCCSIKILKDLDFPFHYYQLQSIRLLIIYFYQFIFFDHCVTLGGIWELTEILLYISVCFGVQTVMNLLV